MRGTYIFIKHLQKHNTSRPVSAVSYICCAPLVKNVVKWKKTWSCNLPTMEPKELFFYRECFLKGVCNGIENTLCLSESHFLSVECTLKTLDFHEWWTADSVLHFSRCRKSQCQKQQKCKFGLNHKSVLADQVEHSNIKVVLVFHTHEAHYRKCFPKDVQCECKFLV